MVLDVLILITTSQAASEYFTREEQTRFQQQTELQAREEALKNTVSYRCGNTATESTECYCTSSKQA